MSGCLPWFWCRELATRSRSIRVAKHSKKVSVIPTATEYAFEGASETIRLLRSAISVVGSVPGAQPVLELALVLIETCQSLTEIESKVTDLKKRIENVMLLMVKGITGKDGANIPKDLIADIEKLGSDLNSIKRDLEKISAQSGYLLLCSVQQTEPRSNVA